MLPPGMKLSLLALGLLVVHAASVGAGDGRGPTRERLTAAECERLVARLANPEKPPFAEDFVLRLPKGVDEKTLRRKQAGITAAYKQLSDNIEVSLPVLVRKAGDDCFSFVYTSTSGAITTESVGGACCDIIAAHVETYRELVTRGDFAGVLRCPSFIWDGCGCVEKWWEGRKGKPLAELQLEAVEWVRRQDRPREFESEEEWSAVKRSLAKMARRIRSSGKPIPVDQHPPRLEVFK